jgi:hypothetical protein
VHLAEAGNDLAVVEGELFNDAENYLRGNGGGDEGELGLGGSRGCHLCGLLEWWLVVGRGSWGGDDGVLKAFRKCI